MAVDCYKLSEESLLGAITVVVISLNTVTTLSAGGGNFEEHGEVAEISITSLSLKLSLIYMSYLLTFVIEYNN